VIDPHYNDDFIKEVCQKKNAFYLSEIQDKCDLAEDLLDESGLFLSTYDNEGNRRFISKEAFFLDSSFSIHFSKKEIEGLYLVAIGRFIPFTHSELPLFVEGRELSLIERKISVNCLRNVLSLDNGQALLERLREKTNEVVFNLSFAAKEPIKVYDLSPIKDELKAGSHLELKLSKDRLDGILVQSDQIALSKIRQWCESLEKSFLSVIKEFGPFASVSEQVSLAYFYGPSLLRKSPSLALRDFINLSPKLEIRDFIFQRIVWIKGEDPLKSCQAISQATQIKQALLTSIEVTQAFFKRIPSSAKPLFKTGESEYRVKGKENVKLDSLVLRSVLWLQNSQGNLKRSCLPIEELLIFDAIFQDIQNLCVLYDDLSSERFELEDFKDALDLSSRMLQEVCELLQMYYCYDSE
jgi:hypothetical protein